MKITKMLGIAMVAAFASMALMGASSASAKPVELCKVKENNCSVANQHPVETKVTASLKAGTKAVLTGSLPVECTVSGTSGELTSLGGQQALAELTTLTFTGCTVFGFIPCEVEAIQTPYVAHITQDNTMGNLGNGYLYVGPQTLQPGAEIKCTGISPCVFKTKEGQPEHEGNVWAKLRILGGEPAEIRAENVELKLTSGTSGECGPQALWNATYVVSPSPAYVVHQEA